ncbi:MAG TPA: hypothetical protein ENJ45_06145 [Phaeodactylibacter sp.]|nr:hypothetical protein [Phaeodactylibacter sp.]
MSSSHELERVESSHEDSNDENINALGEKAPEDIMESLPVAMVETAPEEEALHNFAEVNTQTETTIKGENLPISPVVNSESYIIPEVKVLPTPPKAPKHSPPQKKKKRKKKSLFRRLKEKVVVYLRKLTLSDIRFMDEED